VATLLSGGVIIYPTETFFAIGCMLTNSAAVARIYQAKCRDASLPMPVLGADREQLNNIAIIHEEIEPLLGVFWPGPLTLVTTALAVVPALVTANSGKVALRICSHNIANLLAASVGEALISSSANISGNRAVSRVEDLDINLTRATDGILCEGSQPLGGLASTIIQRENDGSLKILREGATPLSAITELGFIIKLGI